ncbi:PD-(D/E)XK nuclease superfamily protein [Gelidibacter sediminis]|uniref:PD-(D/E)XK nuclease superfamily protein n=1 Tax=Gelidibacter sediminis TaxID=1608710 RepID=A0A4V6Q4Q1_9FLAO|nr:PD-(D/E)XK nuclease family protein [Gelidibacter sediminis]TDU43396.1 PD-(D/E)XK nuclease superfamily protein [Gelidibacter sediminis]
MTSFLKEVVHYIQEEELDIENLTFILPSKRAGTFLKNILSQSIGNTIFAPEILSIEEFVEQLSELKYASNTELLFEFYKVYRTLTPEDQQETFDQFSKWGQLLLQDFNEIDRYLIAPEHIFEYLKSIKELNHWSLSEQQTPYIKNYLAFWNRLKHYYTLFKETLIVSKKGYQGLVYREAVNGIETYIASNPNKQHVFIGFNALNKAEERIIQNLLEHNLARIYWDIDQTFLNNPNHDAGLFIRQHLKDWPYFKHNKVQWIGDNYSSQKNIQTIAIPRNIGQVKYIGELLNTLPMADLKKTAVVLGDETLLMPLLNSIPNRVDTINITMGLPLKSVPLASLFDAIFKIQKNHTNELYYKDVAAILSHSFIQSVLTQDDINYSSQITNYIQSNNIVNISVEKLISLAAAKEDVVRLLFKSWQNDPEEALKNCAQLILTLKAQLDIEKSKHLLALEYLYRFNQIFNELQRYNTKYKLISNSTTLYYLYKELLSSETLDFQGEPLQGLQIMGMLESRVLDFETVIISSVNEGILPAGKTTNSFIPFDVKLENGLPTYKEKDAVYTYHFYRLLQRAKNVYIIYNTEPDVLNGGEKSRFITQLQIENIHDITHSIVVPKVEVAQKSPIIIKKTASVSERLQQIATNGFSPSSLTNYIRNPIDFYYQKVLKVQSFEDVEETVAANTLGSVIHQTLEDFYVPYKGQFLTEASLKHMKTLIKDTVTLHFKALYKEGDMTKGKNLIILEVAKRYVSNFITKEMETLKAGHQIKIIDLEKDLNVKVDIPELDFPVHLRGSVDRIDEFDGTLRIIDYKSGKVSQGQVEIVEWEDISLDYTKYSKSFQVLAYAYMLNETETLTHPIEAGIISFKNLQGDYFLKFGKKPSARSQNKEQQISSETLEAFYLELKKLILEIMNPEIDFIEKDVSH